MTYQNKTIVKHQRGNWFVRLRHNGRILSIYGRTQLDAYAKLKTLVDKIEAEKRITLNEKLLARLETLKAQSPVHVPVGTEVKKECGYTLQEWFTEWLQSYKAGNVRACTIDGFKRAFGRLKGLYGMKITGITNLMLSKALNEVASNRVRDAVHNMLKQVFAVAFNNRLIESNPAANLPRPKQFTKYEKKAFTPEQEKKFVELCLTDLDLYEPFIICVLQGLRKGEMLALRPNDFDFGKNALRIDESYDSYHPEDLQTKNAASNRTMPMFSLTKQVLLKYAHAKPDERIYKFSDITLYRNLERLLKENGLPRLTVHELRHTFISRCHEKHIDEIIVQKWVGHAIGSRMTKAVYTHVADEAELRYIDILNNKNN